MDKRKIIVYTVLTLILITAFSVTISSLNSLKENYTNVAKINELEEKIKDQNISIESKEKLKKELNSNLKIYQNREEKYNNINQLVLDDKDVQDSIRKKEKEIEDVSADIETKKQEIAEEATKHQEALDACVKSFDGIGSCKLIDGMLLITPFAKNIAYQGILNTDAWKELVLSTKVAAKSMADYNVTGISIGNPANPDNILLTVASSGFVLYNVAND